ncbi:SDR family NAD(P)-dependent oxidoreductase [Propioniciclava soli]|uniref:SDR family NAD(P)-dependent oxidoreductase n=1 Tax=Propioniciclava soli TaxID=2775081 RepID=A0ABZ3C6H1_9ACTN
MDDGVRGARVLVTGAAQGMGRMYVERALAEGAAAVHAWDADSARLGELAGLFARYPGVLTSATVVDIADADAVADAFAGLPAEGVDVLVNNAGIVRGNDLFWEAEVADLAATIAVNVLGAMLVTRAVLPGMVERRRPARVVTIASAAALTPNPRMAAYAASKAGVASWSESVRVELERAGHAHVKVTTVYPSYVSTGMFAGARGPLLTPVVEPEVVVGAVWRAMLAGRPTVMVPSSVRTAKVLRGLLPARAYDLVAGRLFRVYGSMDAFTGRPE